MTAEPSDYYQRTAGTHLDGSPIFANDDDRRHEHEAATIIGRALNCEVRSFGVLAPVDWYAVRAGRMVGVLEYKHRTHTLAAYPTVYLNTRKWLSLALAATGLDVPALYVVQWSDAIGWVPLVDIDASRHLLGGLHRRVKAVSDVEPLIEIPCKLFRLIEGP